MTDNFDLANLNLSGLCQNSYPGRGIVIGRSADGYLCQVYWIMGRSQNSRSRVFVVDRNSLYTKPLGVINNPELVIYRAMAEHDGCFLVSNGRHTEQLLNNLEQPALEELEPEDDPPHYTPRIAGNINAQKQCGWLSIVKKSHADDSSIRSLHRFELSAMGWGWHIATYAGDAEVLPSFKGEPQLLKLPSSQELLPFFWDVLDKNNRVACASRIITSNPITARLEVINAYCKD